MRTVIGLDLSYTSTGVSVLHDGVFQPQSSFTYGTTPKDSPSTIVRARMVSRKIQRFLDAYRDGEEPFIFIENYAFMRTNNRELMGELGGIVKNDLLATGFKYELLGITMIRKVITGKGNAKKDQIMYALLKNHGLDITQNDLADATAVALTGDYVLRARETAAETAKWTPEIRDAVKAYIKLNPLGAIA